MSIPQQNPDDKLRVIQSVRAMLITLAASAMTILCVLWNLDVPTRLGVAFLTEQYMAVQLGLALTILFLTPSKGPVSGLIGVVAAMACFIGLGYMAYHYDTLLAEQAYRPPILTLLGATVVFAVVEGVRRRAGFALFAIIMVFLIYALFADRVPGALVGQEMSLVRLVQYLGFDPGAVFSTPLAVGTVIVVLFVFFGQLLFKAGGGEFFTDLAMAATGRTRGGSAKISIIASALFGSISGSAVSNVVTTGVVTIPLMRRGGYSKTDSGAIEAIASTGGQLTPPIMGAAAFLMAEFLEISYLAVASAALLPAIIYYVSIFVQVDLIAARDNIKSVEEDTPDVGTVLRDGWHFIVPMLVLVLALFWLRYDPEMAAILSSVAIIAVGMVRGYKGKRLTVGQIGRVLVDTGTSMVDLILIVAAAGFVIGVLNATGLGFALTLLLLQVIGQNLFVILFAAAVVCVLLGMGMPTSGVYVLLAALIAPSIVEAGVDPLAAHLFILYFGMMSMITPPVALAAFAASAITNANPFSTGVAAMRMGWAAYVVPFVFVVSPSLLLQGEVSTITVDMVLSLAGIFAVSVGIVGYFGGGLSPIMRVLAVIVGLVCLPVPMLGAMVNVTAAIVVAGATLFSLLRARRAAGQY
jgi:TRAP transporter 4TM/12TM fusion protein